MKTDKKTNSLSLVLLLLSTTAPIFHAHAQGPDTHAEPVQATTNETDAKANPAPADVQLTPEQMQQYQAALEQAMTVSAQQVIDDAKKAATPGPAAVKLLEQAVLTMKEGYLFVPREEGSRLMQSWGNTTDADFVGLIIPKEQDPKQPGALPWVININFMKSGYVKDDEAKSWNADDLLASIKEGTEAANQERKAQGFPELDTLGWIQPPTYDDQKHRLIWSILAQMRGSEPSSDFLVNYNTYALGREGFFVLSLITDKATVEKDKEHAGVILANLQYNDGKRYENFTAGTDDVAAFGIAALIAGVAAKKTGLLALLGVAIVKFGKIIALGAIAFFFGIIKFIGSLFSRRKPAAAPDVAEIPKDKAAEEESPSNP